MSVIISILLTVQSFLVFLFAGYEYLTLMHFPALPSEKGALDPLPKVSIIVPVRNQETTVSDCLNSLVHLDYPNKEIIVVDGHSTDGTHDVLARFHDQIILLDEKPLPPGWVGKNWACHLGYQKAQGELLLFTDGDSVHSHDSLGRTVRYLESTEADMVTIAPSAVLRTFWEKLLQPPIFLLVMLFVGGKWVNDDKRKNALGNGQYMLFQREAYEKLGGHYAVRDKIVEDYTLARMMKKSGMRLRMVTANDALGVRMYASLPEIWRGWRKNFYTVSQDHPFPRAVLRIILMFTFLVLPFITFAYGLSLWYATSNPINIYLFTGAFMSFFLWLGIIILDRYIGTSPAYALLFPLAILVYIGIGLDSTIRGAFGLGFSWKGRVYKQPSQV